MIAFFPTIDDLNSHVADLLLERLKALNAPFKSEDAGKIYQEYSTHRQQFGSAGAKVRHRMLWDKAYKELQPKDFNELMDRVRLLERTFHGGGKSEIR